MTLTRPRMALRLSGLRVRTRVIAPMSWRQGSPTSSSSVCLRRSCAGRIGESRFRDRPDSQSGQPARRSKGNGTRAVVQSIERRSLDRTGASEAVFRLRSAHGWIYRPAGCPRVCCLCQRAPFVRTAARTCTRAVCSLCRGPAPSAFRTKKPSMQYRIDQSIPEDIRGPDKVCGPPRPVPRRVTYAARSVSVRDEAIIHF